MNLLSCVALCVGNEQTSDLKPNEEGLKGMSVTEQLIFQKLSHFLLLAAEHEQ